VDVASGVDRRARDHRSSPASRAPHLARVPAMAMPLLISAEMSFDMKPKTE
jgi:hypothetical protein